MHARTHLAGEPDQPRRAQHRRFDVAPHRMRGGVARHAQRLAAFEPRLVLAVNGDAPSRGFQHGADAGIVAHQQRAGRGAHEDLDAGRAGQALKLGDVAHVVMGAADPEGEVAMHALGGARDLVGERRFGRRRWIGVGHFEHGGDAAEHCGAGAGLQIFLVCRAGLAKMHLAVDDAGQHVQPLAFDPLAGVRARKIADGDDAPGDDADVALAHAVLIDERAAGKDRIVGRRHSCLASSAACRRLLHGQMRRAKTAWA